MYEAKIVADSINPHRIRLTTFEITYPLIIHAEIMTHRMFSRNVASNRAIPVQKLIDSVTIDPFIPERFPENKAGMQNEGWLEGAPAFLAKKAWLEARDAAVKQAEILMAQNVHKQIANRLLAPFLWTTAVITATDWTNFFDLRCHPMAQPEIQKIAYMMQGLYHSETPLPLSNGSWHLPYIDEQTLSDANDWLMREDYRGGEKPSEEIHKRYLEILIKVSIGRCARVSYLNHGVDNTVGKDIELCDRLIENNHWSPTEHAAKAVSEIGYIGNFRGWKQYRKEIENYIP